jgi:hypothetical protein
MRKGKGAVLRVTAVVCALLGVAACAQAQVDADLIAKRRLFPEIGPGFKAVKGGPDGKIYVLASPTPGVVVYSSEGKRLMVIRESMGMTEAARKEAIESGETPIGFGEDMDVGSDGTMYIADRANNAIQVYGPKGRHLRSIPVNEPISVAALPEGEVAVTTLNGPELVQVYDKDGHETRDFGEQVQLAERSDLNRFLNIGRLMADGQGHLYYGFEFLPEPTVRQFNRFGYAGQDIRYTEIDAMPEAQAVRREIVRQDARNGPPNFKPVATALGVNRDTGEVWIAMADTLMHFDSAGDRRATYLIYTPGGARVEANAILVEKDRLIIGGDPIGIYEFQLPDDRRP